MINRNRKRREGEENEENEENEDDEEPGDEFAEAKLTFELNLAGVADEHRDEFVKTGRNLDRRDNRSERTGENK